MPNTRQQPKKVPMANIQRNNESPAVDPRARQTPNHSISSPKGINGLRANPSPGSNKEGGTSGRRHVSQSDTERSQSPLALRNGSIVTTGRSSVSGSVSTNGRPSHIEPRDARAKKETTSEIADFIRSTGPEMISHQPMPPPFNSALPILSQKLSGSHMDQPRLAGKQYPVVSARVLTIGASKKTRSKLQARDPTVSYDGETSDLIDFIRQGPALDRTDGGHRIPRSVAPFRRTMDSDEIHALDQGKARESISVASTQDSLAPTKSVHSSSNSRTGLLEKPGRSNIRSSPLVASKAPRLDEPPHPVRKRYRAKDPYLVDSDDEGGDENHLSKPQKHEETIIDFLRAASPAVKTSIPSAFDGVPKPQRNSVQKKTSEPNMREKFDRTTSSQSSKTTESKITIGATSTSSSTRRSRGAPQLPPLTARETSPHLITQNGTKLDSYLPTSPTYAAHVDRERGGPRRGHPQPRAEREPDSGLSDLADFFRNSGPPSPPIKKVPAMVYPKKQKEESGFGRIFSRKKRLAVRT